MLYDIVVVSKYNYHIIYDSYYYYYYYELYQKNDNTVVDVIIL